MEDDSKIETATEAILANTVAASRFVEQVFTLLWNGDMESLDSDTLHQLAQEQGLVVERELTAEERSAFPDATDDFVTQTFSDQFSDMLDILDRSNVDNGEEVGEAELV